ncbi:hypothetical protein phytr_9970 [Candidatus Phycorickettsia trachydisci]|uniref:Methyltransferase n=1 Tax=Candidatus Phycorickettsia trachydisci TaxID=2115978 RepID=A0A2P1P9K5_9RICK|nr:WG repeat-containing protein [Candidatus Phycorickettsia trachydisci]AVP87925.1 hypothetical protein phytr_9970 [Candidatus Phycorickettsia trachydisci]
MQNMQYEKTPDELNKFKHLNHIEISECRTFHKLGGLPLYNPRFIDVEKFHHPGIAPVHDQSGGYHINLDGIAIYKQRFDKTFGFYCDRAAVMDKGKYYHIDLEGNRTYRGSYDWIGNYQEDKCVVRQGDKFFHIDLAGNRLYLEEYDYVGDFKDGIAVVYKNRQATHINYKGHFIHNKWYKKLGIFHKGYANAEDNNGWFHIDIKGEQIYDHRYKMVEPFYNGYAKVETFDERLGQIDITGNIKHVIHTPDTISQMHKISRELVGFWHTYLINAASQMGVLQLLPANTVSLGKKLKVNQENLHRFLRALWEINFISYDGKNDIWQLADKGQFLIDNTFMIKAAKMWGKVITQENWLKIPELLKQEPIQSFLSFKENENNEDIKTEFYQALLGYTALDITEFAKKIDINQKTKVLLFGVHSLVLVDILKSKNINSISYHNEPKLPAQLVRNFDVVIREENDSTKECDLVIFTRFLQHYDDNKVLSYFKALKNTKVSRILLVETVIEECKPMGGIVDMNIMVEAGGKLRTRINWENILEQVGDFSISDILPLTSYLSVIDIRKK